MAVFFILVGLEVKREMFEGSLSSVQKSIFPALAAIGGMIVPALVYLFINHQHPEFKDGWAIPMATDIAFAVGIVALLSKQVPPALKMFLLALAIIDDLGAIVVIAIFFSHEMSVSALTIASLAIIALFVMNRFKVIGLLNYAIVGSILWVSVLKSGVHATLAGVIIGFAIPLKGKNGETPLYHLEHILAPWCTFLILPLFAFSNAGVSLEGMSFNDLTSPLPLGVALGFGVIPHCEITRRRELQTYFCHLRPMRYRFYYVDVYRRSRLRWRKCQPCITTNISLRDFTWYARFGCNWLYLIKSGNKTYCASGLI